jgi:hypothetical protein
MTKPAPNLTALNCETTDEPWDAVIRGADYLFLDFDGILHPVNCAGDGLFCRLRLLEDWMRQRPRVKVVVRSSWRETHDPARVAAHFSPDLRERVVGVTPCCIA